MRINLVRVAASCVLIAGVWLPALADDKDSLPNLTPPPRHMTWLNGKPAYLHVELLRGYCLSEKAQKALPMVEQVRKKLAVTAKIAAEPVTLAKPGEPGVLWLSCGGAPEAEDLIRQMPAPGPQGYRLLVGDEWAVIVGADTPGLYYGLQTFRQLVRPDGTIPCVRISDEPDLPMRGTYIAKTDPRDRLGQFDALRINLVLMESGDFYHLDDPAIRAKWQEIFDACRARFIEPVPELQSLGWGHFVLASEPQAVEAVYKEKVPLLATKDEIGLKPEDPPPALDVRNPGFEEVEPNGGLSHWGQEDIGVTVFFDERERHSGKQCLRIECPEPMVKRAWQDLACLPEKRYELSAFMKIKNIRKGGAYIEVYGLKDSGELGELTAKTDARQGAQDWRRETCAFKSGAYRKLRVYARIQDAAGTAWFDDVAVTGLPPENPLKNVIITEASPFVLTDAVGGESFPAYEEGKDYRLAPGEPLNAAAGYLDTAKPLRIEIVAGGRIKEGDTVLANFNYAPPGSVTCCPSEPLYQDFMRKAIRNVVTYLHPRYIHIGHDEPRVLNQDSRCKKRGLSNAELFVDDVRRMRQYIQEADPNTRVMMWDDAVNPFHNAPAFHMEKAAENIPRDVIICAWFYHWPDPNDLIEKSAKFFLDLGFDTTGSPWYIPENAYHWAQTLAHQREGNPHVLGEIYTSWADTATDPWQALPTMAEYSWNHNAMPLKQFLKN